jgi:hypothetical protein
VRLCLLISLTISPLWADFWNWVTEGLLTNQSVSIGPYSYALPGVRIALWGGGIITFVAGLFAWRSIRRAERHAAAAGEAPITHTGPTEPIRPLGLVEPSPVLEPDEHEAHDEPASTDETPEAGAGP